ncbi:MAG: hypothetical protein ACSHX0_11755 [Akkermansiaceae bacterium]
MNFEEAKKTDYKPVVYLGLIVLVIFGLGLYGASYFAELKLEKRVLVTSDQVAPAETVSYEEEREPLKWLGASPSKIAEQFLQASSHKERLALISNPERDGEQMREFFESGPGSREKFLDLISINLISDEGVFYQPFSVRFTDASKRTLAVVHTKSGGRVDYRSYARYCTESWSDVLSGVVTEVSEARVFIKPSIHYIRNYSDDEKWAAFSVSSPDFEGSIQLYVEKYSRADAQLGHAWINGIKRVTLSFRSVNEGFKHGQFEVTDVLKLGWVVE